MRYAIIIEKTENNYSAFVPDLPGCVGVGDTLEEVKENIQEAITFHLDSLMEEGLTIPLPQTECGYVEIAA